MPAALVIMLLFTIFLGLPIVGVVSTYRALIYLRRLCRTPTMPIVQLPSVGEVAVEARAGDAVMLSPINHIPCVLWKLDVEGGSGQSAHSILTTCSTPSFDIVDVTGQLQIFPEKARLMITRDRQRAVQCMLGDIITAVPALRHQRYAKLTKSSNQQVRATEQWIAPGDPIFAIGILERTTRTWQLQASGTAPLILTNRTRRSTVVRAQIGFVMRLIALICLLAIYVTLLLRPPAPVFSPTPYLPTIEIGKPTTAKTIIYFVMYNYQSQLDRI